MTTTPATTADAETLETIADSELVQAGGGYGPADYRSGQHYGQQSGQSYGYQPSYTVRPGDNLTNIAKQSGHSLDYLLRLNPQYQKNPNLIHPGEQVVTGRRRGPCY